jgi:hypothetical protein
MLRFTFLLLCTFIWQVSGGKFQAQKGGDGMGFTADRHKPIHDGFQKLPSWEKKHTGKQTKLQHEHKSAMGFGDGKHRKRNLRRHGHNKASKHHVKFKS